MNLSELKNEQLIEVIDTMWDCIDAYRDDLADAAKDGIEVDVSFYNAHVWVKDMFSNELASRGIDYAKFVEERRQREAKTPA